MEKKDLISVVHGSLWISLASIVMNVLGFTFWLLCSKFFTTSSLGYATTAFSIAFMVSSLMNFGFNYVILREVPVNRGKVLTACLVVALGISVIASSACYLFKNVYPGFERYIPLIILIVISSLIVTISSTSLIAVLKPKHYFIVPTSVALLKLIIIITLILLGIDSVGILLSITLSIIVGAVLGLFFCRKYVGFSKFSSRDVVHVLKVGFSNYPQVLSTQLLISSGIVLISWLTRSPSIAGIVYIIIMATLALAIIPNSLAIAGLPVMMYSSESIGKISNEGIRLGLGVVTPLIVFVGVCSSHLLSLLRPEYVQSALAFTMLVLSIPLITISFMTISKLNAEGKFRVVLTIGLLRLCTLLLTLPVLIKIHPFIGTACSFILSNLAPMPIILRHMSRVVFKYLLLVSVIQVVSVSIGHILIMHVIDILSGLVMSLISLLLLNLCGILTLKDLKFLINLIVHSFSRRARH